ncbi:MAG: amidohydrolase [Saprospiraceae bacterium]
MKSFLPVICCLIALNLAGQTKADQDAIQQSVDQHRTDLISLSDQIWAFAETALEEYQSSQVLADYAESQGFDVERGVAGMPTAFIASFGSGRPIIGVLGEYDALPGLSQQASTDKKPLVEGDPGHGCGHNLFGAASLGAAIAVKEWMEKTGVKGTVRFYGTPAEESVGGKVYMARAGLFDDLDACLDWHPDYQTKASTQSSQAVIDYLVNFHGKAAHAAFDPWNGRSALDGVESFVDGINLLREHVRPTVRMHYVISKGGQVPNVVPEEAQVWIWIRDSKMPGVLAVSERMKEIARGAALIAGVESEVVLQNGIYDEIPNRRGAAVLQANLELLGPIQYTEDEQAFARKLQASTGIDQTGVDASINPLEPTLPDPPGGSTDVGDVSWIVPQISLLVTTAPVATPWHAWPVVACGGMSIGHKGMVYAAKALGLTMMDLFNQPQTLEEMKAEFLDRKGDLTYEAMLPAGPPPVPEQN